MLLKVIAIALAMSALPAAAADRYVTTRDAAVCESARGAVDYWRMVDKKPASITLEAWLESIGCFAVKPDLEVVPLRTLSTAIRAIVVSNGKPLEVWFVASSIANARTGERYD
jgi:hypothetical protein